MEKSTFEFFSEKFRANLPDSRDEREAFEKTVEDIGFRPYKTYESYYVVKYRDRRRRRG